MSDVASDLEAIYEALSSSVANAEQRKTAFEAFESFKIKDEAFEAACSVVGRRKSEGSVYTALLVIEHQINNFWHRLVTSNFNEKLFHTLESAASLNTNLVAVGAAKVGCAACLHDSRMLESFFIEFGPKSLPCSEIFFLIVDHLATTVTDYCKNIPNRTRQDLRTFFIKQAGRIFSEAFEKVNQAFMENDINSHRLISSIFGAVSQLISSELSLIRDIIKNEDLCGKFITLSFLLLDRFSHRYHESVVTFLKFFAEKILTIITSKDPVTVFVSDDKLLTLATFVKSCSNYVTRNEAALFFHSIVRMIIDSTNYQLDMYPQYVFDVLSSLIIFSEPSINLTCARVLHLYALGLYRQRKPIYYKYFELIIDLYFKICINYKKGEYTITYNSIGEDNLSLKDSEGIVYRFATSLFANDQIKVMLISTKFVNQIISSFLYDESMSVVECSGIAFGLKNIYSVLDPSTTFKYQFTETLDSNPVLYDDSDEKQNLVKVSLEILNRLINSPIKTLRQLNCFLDLSISLLSHFYIHSNQVDIYLRTLHGHCLGFIQASKEYSTLNIESIYWLRRSNKSLTLLLKAIWVHVKVQSQKTDVYQTFLAIVSDVAMNLCILDWIEKDHLDNYFFIQAFKNETPIIQTSYSFFINIVKKYYDNQLFMNGINNINTFLDKFSIGEDTIGPESFENLKQLFQIISLVCVYYNDLKVNMLTISTSNSLYSNICKESLDVYTLLQKIWKCYCGIFDRHIEARRSPQLLRAISALHSKMVECSYEQKFTSFENLEHRIYLLGKNLISSLSSLFIFNMKFFSDTTIYVAKTFVSDIWKPFTLTPFILFPYFTNSIFVSYIENIREIKSHKLFLDSIIDVFDDISLIVTNRCSIIKNKLEEIEKSTYKDEGNDIVEASNVTEEVIFALSRICFRFLEVSSSDYSDISRIINENAEHNPSISTKFESIVYTYHPTWIATMKLVLTLVAFGNSKLINRIFNNNFFENHFKLRLNHIEKNPSLYTSLVTLIFTSLYSAYQNKDIYYQAGILIVNMLIYVISTFKNIYPGIPVLLQQITSYSSSNTIIQAMNLISQADVSLKDKRQAIIRILDRVSDDNENINILMNELENFKVTESEKCQCKYDIDYKALSDSDLVDIRFLFE